MRKPDRQSQDAGLPACRPLHGLQAAGGASLNKETLRGGRPRISESTGKRDEEAGETGSARPRRWAGTLALAAAVVALDAVTKAIAVAQLSGRAPVELVGGILTLRLIRNSGAAFGIGGGLTVVFSLVSIVVAVAIVRVAFSVRCAPWMVALGMLLGGALGNLSDRLLRPPAPLFGHVVDWIELPHWPVFNLADVAIVCGGVLAVILATRGVRVDGGRAGGEANRHIP